MPVFKMNRLGLGTVFGIGAISMMLVMSACMILTAAVIPSASPLTIICSAIFGPIFLALGSGAGAYKVKQMIESPQNAPLLLDRPVPIAPPGGEPVVQAVEELDDDDIDDEHED